MKASRSSSVRTRSKAVAVELYRRAITKQERTAFVQPCRSPKRGDDALLHRLDRAVTSEGLVACTVVQAGG